MPAATKTKIRKIALALLKESPNGLRYKELHRGICEMLPEVSSNTVASEIHTLRHTLQTGSVVKGLYRYLGEVDRGS